MRRWNVPGTTRSWLLIFALLAGAAGCSGSGTDATPTPVAFDVGANDHTAVAAFGEGLTVGAGSGDGAGYRNDLAALLAADGRTTLRIVNEGVTGSTSAQGAARISEVLSRVRPAALLLLYGSSDPAIVDLQPPLDAQPRAVADNLRVIIGAARANRTLVVVSTLPPVCGTGRVHERERTAAVNATIRGLALELGSSDLGVVLVDAWGDFTTNASPDGCGLLGASGNLPTDAGYAVLAETFHGGLKNLAW